MLLLTPRPRMAFQRVGATVNARRPDRPPRPMKKAGFRKEPEKKCLPRQSHAAELMMDYALAAKIIVEIASVNGKRSDTDK